MESPKLPAGTGRGRGQPYGQEFLGENPRKSPRGWGGEGGQSRAWGFLGENPRKNLYFGAGTKVEFSGIFPSLHPTPKLGQHNIVLVNLKLWHCSTPKLRHHGSSIGEA